MSLRFSAAFAFLFAAHAAAQTAPLPSAATPASAATCAECGVIRSIKRAESTPRITPEERKSTSGLVASIPFGGKPTVGSSTDVRREQQMPVVTYEVVVRLDDGRFQVVVQDEVGAMREGDKVRVERGKVVLRDQ